MPQCDDATKPQCHNATMTQCHNTTMPQCHDTTMPQCHNATKIGCRWIRSHRCRRWGSRRRMCRWKLVKHRCGSLPSEVARRGNAGRRSKPRRCWVHGSQNENTDVKWTRRCNSTRQGIQFLDTRQTPQLLLSSEPLVRSAPRANTASKVT